MCSLVKTFLEHNTNDFDKNYDKKIKCFDNIADSMIFGGHFENMQIRA